MNITEEII